MNVEVNHAYEDFRPFESEAFHETDDTAVTTEIVIWKRLVAEPQSATQAGGGEQDCRSRAPRLAQFLLEAAGQQIQRFQFALHALHRPFSVRRLGERKKMHYSSNRSML